MFTLHLNSTTARWTRGLGGLLVAALAVTSCGTADEGGGGATGPGAGVASVQVSPATATIGAVGATQQFAAVAKDAGGNAIAGKTFTWASDGVTVATVNTSGLATAVADGIATITATTDGVQGTAALTVAQGVATVEVTPAAGNVGAVGNTLQFSAAAKDVNGNVIGGKTFTWASSDALIATVDATGLATAVANGTATISATTDAIVGSASFAITPPVASIDVAPGFSELNAIGVTQLLTAVANDALGNPIPGVVVFTWASSDVLVATVDVATGLATSVGIGTTTISATADGISGSASLSINLTGTGTGSLLVIADVVANDIGSGLYTTEFEVTLTDAFNLPVSGATVTITNSVGITTLVETVAASGIYTAAAFDFVGGDYELDVVAGSHSVNDVVARGPGIHTITAPLLNSVHPADQDLTVTWMRPSGPSGFTQAQFARVETRDFTSDPISDDGGFVILGVDNPAEPAQLILVLRTNQVTIAGGLLGSRLQIEIEAEVDPVVIQ